MSLKSISLPITLLIVFHTINAGPFALFGSLQTTHNVLQPTGGLRYSPNDDICFDVSVGAAAAYEDDALNCITGYFDFFFFRQSIGLGVTVQNAGDNECLTTIGLLYALEKAVTEKVILGISPTIVAKTFDDKYGIDFLPGFAVYTLISW